MTSLRSLSLRLGLTVIASSALVGHAFALETKVGQPVEALVKQLTDGIKKIREYIPLSFTKAAEDRLIASTLNGMLAALDPTGNSYVFKKSAGSAASKVTPAVSVRRQNGLAVLASVTPHSEAFRHDVRQGDVLMRLDGKLVAGQDLASVETALIGDAGSSVKVTVFRPSNGQVREETLKRESTEAPVYARTVAKTIGYVQVSQIGDREVTDFEAKLRELFAKHKLQGVILDLRNTSGGTPALAARIADPFLADKDKAIAKVSGADGTRSIGATTKTTHVRVPVVVLQNQGTQGAAEVAALALQENHRAILMGEATAGVGAYEVSQDLANDWGVRLSTTSVAGPSGKEIRGIGVAPDIQETDADVAAAELGAFRDEFTAFCKGVPRKVEAKSSPASVPSTGPTTSPMPSDDDEEETNAKNPDPKAVNKSDQILDEYPLVKRHDIALVRAVNLLVSTGIFYQFLQN